MDVSLLTADEINIECLVRDLPTEGKDVVKLLRERLQAEYLDRTKVPTNMHPKGVKNPAAEIAGCQAKLMSLKVAVGQLESLNSGEQQDGMKKIIARLTHLRGRLDRAISSPTYSSVAKEVLQSCEGLLETLQVTDENTDELNISISAAKSLVIQSVSVPLYISPVQVPEAKTYAPSVSGVEKEITPSEMQEPLERMYDQRRTFPQSDLVSASIAAVKEDSAIPIERPSLDRTGPSNILPNINYPDMNPHNSTMHQNHFFHPVPISSANHLPTLPTVANYPSRESDYERRSLARCGLSYSGSPSGITVDMFLFQLNSVADSNHISDDVLLVELYLLLKDVAVQWYWTYRRHNPRSSWSALRSAFYDRFRDRRTQWEIRRMVESRKQQAGESFLDFYNHMWSLTLQCHSPYSDAEFIQLLFNNMKPVLQFHLTDRTFSDINELIKSCTAWESALSRSRFGSDISSYYRRGINAFSANFEDDLGTSTAHEQAPNTETLAASAVSAIQPSGRPFSNPIPSGGEFSGRVNNPNPPPGSRDGYVVCFNCQDVGHTFMNCMLAPSGMFCYRCGKRDTITPRCPNCSGNQVSGSWRVRAREPLTQTTPRITREDAASNTDRELGWRNPQNRPPPPL